ncbi:MAG: MaoC family dehydratase [Jatrophihabitans sp.]|uniref:MaoC family dehydratase n=1 Tax=Jatrophihabitans sp. TaxID=1932789 RepID=UPI003F7EF7CA
MTHADDAFASFQQRLGQPEGTGDWWTVTQEQIDAFADVTDDHQFIHVDPARAATESPWGTTIAHGFLTLSLLTPLSSSIPARSETLTGILMGVNYGFDKVRFINPVKVGSRIRASSVLAKAEQRDANTLQVTRAVTVEIEGESKPALSAEWITRLVYA